MKWTICIATVPVRAKRLERLMKVLLPQVDRYKGQIEVLIFFNNFEQPIGTIRQKLLEEARGEYISFIDDDDMIPQDFCKTILPLLDGVDYIGFKVDFYDNGLKMAPVYHSLKYPVWSQDDDGYYRGITHLNPLRTELARQSSFMGEVLVGEDHRWAVGVRAKTEHYIDRPMYVYEHDHEASIAYEHKPAQKFTRPVFASQNVRFHPKSTEASK